jgi:hypothetical protein
LMQFCKQTWSAESLILRVQSTLGTRLSDRLPSIPLRFPSMETA